MFTSLPTPDMTPYAEYQRLVKSNQIVDDNAQHDVLAALQTLFHALKRQRSMRIFGRGNLSKPHAQGVYIWGEVGRGKSLLMDIFYGALSGVKKRRVHFHAFMQEVHAHIHLLRGASGRLENPAAAVAEHMANHFKVLCLDEFQVQDVADAMILSQLFTTLFKRGVSVVMTSNRAPEDLYQNGLQREQFLTFVATLRQHVRVMELKGREDYRMSQLKAMQRTYVYPLGKEADAFIMSSFKELIHHHPSQSREIMLQGRTLSVHHCSGKVAMFTFDELCAKPLGAMDYLALATHFRIVLLAGIPRLTPDKRNEAKRFVTLIDALYDHKVKLVCTADAPPEALYPAGDGSFEFARTVSRLVEMQSQEYIEGTLLTPEI